MPAPSPWSLRGVTADLNRRSLHDPNDARVRLYVSQRAAEACEYCLMPTEARFEVDHIVPKARWTDYQANSYAALRTRQRVTAATYDHISNFAWACFFCNRYKSGRPRPRGSTRLYDPRGDTWTRHFAFSRTKGYVVIVGLTAIGRETVRALNFHGGGEEGALAERATMIGRDLYPPAWLRVAYRI